MMEFIKAMETDRVVSTLAGPISGTFQSFTFVNPEIEMTFL